MATSFTFTSLSFQVVGATQISNSVVRIQYSAAPKQASSVAADDATNTLNYTVSGPIYIVLSSASVVYGDPTSIDLTFAQALSAGTWTFTVANVKTPAGTTIGAPTQASLTVSSTANASTLTAGAENDTAARIIRKHLNPALAGDNWDALIEALSVGDDFNWDNAQLAFDQLFVASASGKYLERLASNAGIVRPDIGMSDDLFRQLVTAFTNHKLTHDALRRILEVFFGEDALRAYAETELVEPFVLADGLTLDLVVDQDTNQEYTIEFDVADFASISAATAEEVANVINKNLRVLDRDSFAVAYVDYATGDSKVRIYSGSLGPRSFIQITGGTAQDVLRFPTHRDVYSGTVTNGDGYGWVYTNPVEGQTKLVLTEASPVKLSLLDVVAGDYVIIGPDANSVEGVYTISAVDFYYSGGNTVQSITIEEDLGFTGTAVQDSNSAYRFFSPTLQTTLQSGKRVATVTQTTPGVVDVRIPATTQAVNRDYTNAAYIKDNTAVDILRYQRDQFGTVTVETSAAHGLSVGDQVWLDVSVPASSFAFSTPGDQAGSESGAGHTSFYSSTEDIAVQQNEYASCARLSDGTVYFHGGGSYTAGVYGGTTDDIWWIVADAATTDTSGTEAAGSLKHGYTIDVGAASLVPRQYHSMTTLSTDQLLVAGGLDDAGPTVLASAQVYSPGTDSWANTSSPMAEARHGHEAVLMEDGRVIVMGGASNHSTALKTCEIYNPSTNAWISAASMTFPRYRFKSVLLDDGRVMAIGGTDLADVGRTGSNYLTALEGMAIDHWSMDDVTLVGLNDNLTPNGTPANAEAQINDGVDFAAANTYFSGASTVGGMPGLLQTDDFTVQFWAMGDMSGGGVQAAVCFGGTTGVQADNILIEVGFTNTGAVYWLWENGAGVNVTATSTATVTSGPTHVALRRESEGGGLSTVKLYLNGVLSQTWTGQTDADGGTTSIWYVGTSAKTLANRFVGVMDDVWVFGDTYTAADILKYYWRSVGSAKTAEAFSDGGHLLNTCEIYDPNLDSWEIAGSMTMERMNHAAYVLSDGRVVVAGGVTRKASQLPANFVTNYENIWPNESNTLVEVWHPETERWHAAPRMPRGNSRPVSALLEDDVVWMGYGSEYAVNYATPTLAETDNYDSWIMNPDTLEWTMNPAVVDATGVPRDSGAHSIENVVVAGGGRDDDNNTYTNADLWIKASSYASGGGLTGQHKVASIVGGTTFTVETPDYPFYSSNFGLTAGGKQSTNQPDPNIIFNIGLDNCAIANIQRTSNVTTITLGQPITLAVGDKIFSNILTSGYTPGIYTITAVDTAGLTASYAETGGDLGFTVAEGFVSIMSETPTYSEVGAAASSPATTNPGPYVYDPISGLSLTDTSTTTSADIEKNSQTSVMTVTSTADFPDSAGYFVLDFGGPNQTVPIKYLEKISSTELLLDYRYEFQADFPAGTSVDLLDSRAAYVPEYPDDAGTFYLTGSTSGRLTAETFLGEAVAAGITLNLDVVYPGDRGLGGEGNPTTGEDKLSDVVGVYGQDDVG